MLPYLFSNAPRRLPCLGSWPSALASPPEPWVAVVGLDDRCVVVLLVSACLCCAASYSDYDLPSVSLIFCILILLLLLFLPRCKLSLGTQIRQMGELF